jgi:hypothetical protein
MAHEDLHLTIARIWEYSRNPNPAKLAQSEFDHLSVCEDCAATLWVCHTCPSVEQVERRLSGGDRKLG